MMDFYRVTCLDCRTEFLAGSPLDAMCNACREAEAEYIDAAYEHAHNCVCSLCYSEGTPFITALRGW